jgi:hypothetical protein
MTLPQNTHILAGSRHRRFCLAQEPPGISRVINSMPDAFEKFRRRILLLQEIAGRQDFFDYFLGHKKVILKNHGFPFTLE